MTTDLFPPAMKDIRVAARAAIADLTTGGVFFKFTPATKYPAVRLHRAGGGPDGGEVPSETLRVVFDIFGRPATAAATAPGSFDDVTAIARRLASWLHTLSGVIGTGATRVLNAEATSIVDAADPDGDGPRQILTATISVIAA